MRLTMGYHYGPSADLLYPGVCERVPLWDNSHPFVGGGVRIHPENDRRSDRHGVQYESQCVACAALTLVVWQ